MRIALLMFAASALFAGEFKFEVRDPGVVVAELQMRSPRSDWAAAGHEAAVAVLRTDGGTPHHVILYGGEALTPYRVFLGNLGVGRHKLKIEQDKTYSASGTKVEVKSAQFSTHPALDPVAFAPVLFARKNTIGKFSDVPTIVYCEKLQSDKGPFLQYTAIFSNEDGGTSTRALMARWGRTTDIEYMYRVYLDAEGKPGPAIIQGPNHVDTQWAGPMEGFHPMLMPVTNNNTFGASDGASPLRFQIAPIVVDLTTASRESVMDQYPVTWTVMDKELIREAKLRPFGTVDGEKISDPRNYLYIDYSVGNEGTASSVHVRLRGKSTEYLSDLGLLSFGIDRPGNVRTTVELPPGTSLGDIEALGFDCKAKNKERAKACEVRGLSSIFLLDKDGQPGPRLRPEVPRKTLTPGEIFWQTL